MKLKADVKIMRKFICTATVFLGMTSIVIASCCIQLPNKIWWIAETSKNISTIPLLGWLILNIGSPVVAIAVLVVALHGFWQASGVICAKLRGEK